jgi:hypothetical protein
MVWDQRQQRCVLFGGQTRKYGTWPLLNDTWTFDGAQWQRAEGWFAFVRPRARCAHCLAYDEATGQVVLFGGSVGASTVADTWVFENRGWKRRRTQRSPSPREYCAMAYDPARRACVLHGGSADDEGTQGSLSDTWTFDGHAWESASADPSAGPRDDFALAYFRGQVNALVITGSRQTSHTASLGSKGWTPVTTIQRPSRRQCAAMVYHDALNAGLLHGGELHHGGPLFSDTWLLRPP